MQECLGISITNKLIRYAKLQKSNNNDISVSTYGLKFYDNLQDTLNQIITETNSNKVPISVNLKNEKYYYFNIFNLTNKTYAEKAISTEFESFCSENHLNKNAYEGRYIYTKSMENQDQSKVVYIYDSKNEIDEITNNLKNQRISSITPNSTSLPNLLKIEKNKNILIVNIEENTTLTTISDQAIYNVDIVNEGMNEILDKINEKENSYSKAYEVCKNTTIYTMETSMEDANNSEYLKYIIPTLYKIVQQVQQIKEKYKKIDQIYISGMGSVINNIDLYFKEYFKDSKVEILKPYFIESQQNINVRDIVEVDSAISLALQGLGYGIKNLNFAKNDWKQNLKALLNTDLKELKFNKPSLKPTVTSSGIMTSMERIMIMDCVMLAVIIAIYAVASIIISKQINDKTAEATDVINDTTVQISLANSDDSKINTKITDYQKYKTNLENVNSVIEIKNSRKNQITTLLNQIIYIIPKEVQLTEIKNTENVSEESTTEHITIYAQSKKYEQLAYFKAQLKSKNVLNNITSTEGTKDGDIVKIAIEGDLKNY